MQICHGKSVFGGIAIGKIHVFSKKEKQIKRIRIEDSAKETARYEEATRVAKEQLCGLYEKALKENYLRLKKTKRTNNLRELKKAR